VRKEVNTKRGTTDGFTYWDLIIGSSRKGMLWVIIDIGGGERTQGRGNMAREMQKE